MIYIENQFKLYYYYDTIFFKCVISYTKSQKIIEKTDINWYRNYFLCYSFNKNSTFYLQNRHINIKYTQNNLIKKGENMYNFISKSEKDTINFAKGLASKLHKGDIIVLTGELGSGKTKFTQGFLEYFGLENEISSPTFTIVNEYNSNTGLNIYHFDVYRLSDTDEFYAIGGDEYFENGICIIEWGELIKDALPKDYIHITFEKDDSNENYRKLKVETFGNKYQNLF